MFRERRADFELIVVAFRGTAPFDAVAWSTDVDISFYEIPNVGKVHAGFMKALGLQRTRGWPKDIEQGGNDYPVAYYTIRENLKKLLTANEKAKFILTGHSLGGALAVLFALVLAFHEEKWMLEKLDGIYTFGQPRIGNEKFGKFMVTHLSAHGVPYVRSVYCNDIVPRLPFDNSADLYRHFGNCLYYNSLYEGMVRVFISLYLPVNSRICSHDLFAHCDADIRGRTKQELLLLDNGDTYDVECSVGAGEELCNSICEGS